MTSFPMVRRIALSLSLLGLSVSPAYAEQQSVGLHHLTPKPAVASPTPQKAEPAATNPASPQSSGSIEAKSPQYRPLTIEEALYKQEDLKIWSGTNFAATANSKEDVEKLVHMIEADRGAVPPIGLFLAAKALANQGKMDLAAMYLFAGQLRLTFDITRWPPRANEDDVKRLNQDKNKTKDQAAPTMGAEPRINNPHLAVSKLSEAIGQPIIEWAVKDPTRLSETINRVRIWDASATYAYDPGYDLSPALSFEEWPRVLEKVRTNYFERMTMLLNSIEKAKGQ